MMRISFTILARYCALRWCHPTTAMCREHLCPKPGVTCFWHDVLHHVRGRCPSFIAHTGSCARPKPSRRLRFNYYDGSLQVVASPCWEMALPSVISADPPLGAWTLTPVAPMVHIPISSHRTSAFPDCAAGRLPTTISTQWRLLCGFPFGAADIPLCSGPQVCWPLWSPPQCIKQSGSDF
jgi:hypothetical protein